MPEGDTIFRAARTLHLALSGRTVTRFASVFPRLTRLDADRPIAGRSVDRVEARGKHLLIWLDADLVLRTHMRMNGSWHIYRPGERWQRPHGDMRIVIETAAMHAVAFNVPVAEFVAASRATDIEALNDLGPDLLSADFDPSVAAERLMSRSDVEVADALLDQTAVAGIGNVYKSEVLFLGRVDPFSAVGRLDRASIVDLMTIAAGLLRANVATGAAVDTRHRRTTPRDDPAARLWVYGRAGKPCRRCGTPISRRKQGPHARSTYWCARCQPPVHAGAG
jgi:endonuclease-8